MQKRVGTALRKLKRKNPGFGGAGKLTDPTIDTLQHYYGIISKCGQFDRNEKAIHAHASLMRCASNKYRPLHDHCPTGSTSWCKYHKDKANKTKLHKHGLGFPWEVIAKVKSEYVSFSNDSFLEVFAWENAKLEWGIKRNDMAMHP